MAGSGAVSHFVFDTSGALLGEYDGATGSVIAEYIWFAGRLVASIDGAGTLSYVQTGHLWQPLLVMDGSASVLWRGETTPFGSYVYTSGAGSDPDLRFPGQWLEAGSGLYQNWHRDYDPSLGRYIEADPLGLAAGQSLYGYVGQDPLNWIDPEGLFWETLWDAANAAFSAGRVAGYGVQGRWDEAGDELLNFSSDGAAMCTPGIPAGAGAARRLSRGKQTRRGDGDEGGPNCEASYASDTATCTAISRMRGKQRGTVCHASAAARYSACLRGEPPSQWPPLNTWNN